MSWLTGASGPNDPIGVATVEAIGMLNWSADRLKMLSIGTTTYKIITGDGHDHRAIWRVDQTAPAGRYTLDNAARIGEMKDRGFTEAREQLPELRRHFFDRQAQAFVPFRAL